MENNYQGMTKSSFWANLFKTPTEKSELEEVLLSMPPFKYLSNKNIKLLMKVIHNRIYAANEYIFFQGDPGIGLYLIIRGEILITEEIDGERFDLAMLTRGDFLENSLYLMKKKICFSNCIERFSISCNI